MKEKFEFIIPTYDRPNQLMMTIHSIYSQSVDNWRITVVVDAPYKGLDKVIKYFDGDDRIRFDTTLKNGPHNDWGHTPRIRGMEIAEEEWLIMTGDDNYYFPCFLEAFSSAVDDNTLFIFCDMYHNYSGYDYGSSELRKIPIPGGFRYEGLDIGAFATRTKLAKQIPFYRHLHWADGKFAADYWEKHCKVHGSIKKIPKGFYVHN